MSKVFITDRISNPTIEREILGDEVTLQPNKSKVEVLMVWHQIVDKNLIDQFPNLKSIIRYGVGFDKIDIDYASRKGITVSNSPDYCTEEVSNTSVSMILNCTRRTAQYNSEAKKYTKGWQENVIKEIRRDSEMTVGIIGVGRIGSCTLLKCNALGFKTCFYDPGVAPGYEKILSTDRCNSLEELLNKSDVVSLHIPLNKENTGIINHDFVTSMKDGSALVSTARGGLLDNYDVIYQAIKSKKLAMVALDVLPNEPPISHPLINDWKNNEKDLSERLIINPHAAYYSKEAGIEMRYKAALNAKGIINGVRAINIVNQKELSFSSNKPHNIG